LRKPADKPIQLTLGPIHWSAPTFSKDGKTLFAIGSTSFGELGRIDKSRGLFQPIVGGISAVDADISPDGGTVAYVSFPERNLWLQKLDGSKRIQLTEQPINPYFPRWSPDGRHLLFQNVAQSSAGKNLVTDFVISADGGKPQQFLPDNLGDETNPSWSPDGEKVLFDDFPEGTVHIFDIHSRRIETLPDSNGFWLPNWSPDGRYISALSIDGTILKIFDVKIQKWKVLRVGAIDCPAWSHDSKFIYFLNFKTVRSFYACGSLMERRSWLPI
jgi:Tol biopolymer transport system component